MNKATLEIAVWLQLLLVSVISRAGSSLGQAWIQYLRHTCRPNQGVGKTGPIHSTCWQV